LRDDEHCSIHAHGSEQPDKICVDIAARDDKEVKLTCAPALSPTAGIGVGADDFIVVPKTNSEVLVSSPLVQSSALTEMDPRVSKKSIALG